MLGPGRICIANVRSWKNYTKRLKSRRYLQSSSSEIIVSYNSSYPWDRGLHTCALTQCYAALHSVAYLIRMFTSLAEKKKNGEAFKIGPPIFFKKFFISSSSGSWQGAPSSLLILARLSCPISSSLPFLCS